MIKNLLFLVFLVVGLSEGVFAQGVEKPASGYYQQIDLDANTPCNCNEKTEQGIEKAKRIKITDISNPDNLLLTYKIDYGTNVTAFAKLAKALEKDPLVKRVSFIEWTHMTIVVDKQFDRKSFEQAASKVFKIFNKSATEDYLSVKDKNLEAKYRAINIK